MEIEVAMSYIKQVTRSSPEFTPLVRLIEKVRGGKHGNPKYPAGTELIKATIREQYSIDIGERVTYEGVADSAYTPVDFGDEQNYIMFMLKWA